MSKLLTGLLSLAIVSFAFAADIAPKSGVDALAWLAGRWEFEKNGRVVREEWMVPGGGTMLGMSRTVKDGKTIEYEHLFLGIDEQGDLSLIATPSGQSRAAFKLIKVEGRSVVFENKAHDFPQRVGYTLNADGTLSAFIEGETQGVHRRIEFLYRPVK
jgi:hypothetical protein